MSKYIDLEDAIGIIQKEIDKVVIESDYDNTFRVGLRLAKNMLLDLPTIEVSEGVIGYGNGDIDWLAVRSTGQEIYAKGYEDGRKSVEVSEDCVSREWVRENMLKYGFTAPDMTVTEFVDDAPSVVPTVRKNRTVEQSSKVGECKRGKWIAIQVGNDWNYGTLACSECKIAGFTTDTPFCPNCGADMRGSDNE